VVKTIRSQNNENKTEICLLSKNEVAWISIKIGNTEVITGNSMNVLGVIFDSRLCCSKHLRENHQKVE
jgi:hypothetical protein